LNSSFWFVPGIMTAGGVLLFVVTLQLEQLVPSDVSGLPVVFSGGADAARTVLSVISGSLITVVATVFSLTIVALQLASANYSPRLLRNFTSDRGVQAVLGAYIGTFTYSLLVLRVIRTPRGAAGAFVPIISVTTAVVLALVCVALLVYFIHHIASLIQSSTIVRRVRLDTLKSVSKLDDLGDSPAEAGDPEDHPEVRELLRGDPLVVRAKESGYVQYVYADAVVEAVGGVAEETVVEIPFGPGHFVAAGLPLLKIWPAPEGGLAPDSEDDAHDAIVFGKERSFGQDFAFGLRQLSDIALKGVSPGVNDPTTAMQAMDQMEAIFAALGEKAMPPRLREGHSGGSRVLLKVGRYGFEDAVGLAFDQLRRASFTSGQVAVLERLLEVVERALGANEAPGRRAALWERAFAVGRLAPGQISDPRDAVRLVCRAVTVGAPLLKTELGATVGSELEELADLSEGLSGGEQVREAVDAASRSVR
jgi:uncharacterized membrane protein